MPLRNTLTSSVASPRLFIIRSAFCVISTQQRVAGAVLRQVSTLRRLQGSSAASAAKHGGAARGLLGGATLHVTVHWLWVTEPIIH